MRAGAVEAGIETWARYVVTATSGEGDDLKVVWEIEIECFALFGFLEDRIEFEHDDLMAFALLVGAPGLHPFVRDYVQSLTSKSAFPAFTMGLMTPLTSLPDDEEVDISDHDEP